MDPQPRNQQFPHDAVAWLLGTTARTVAVLGDAAIAAALAAHGHDVTNVEGTSGPDPLPFPEGSVDAVLSASGVPRDLDDVVRVLRPGGHFALVHKVRDRRIPWARKLDDALSLPSPAEQPAARISNSEHFGEVAESAFRHWQLVTHESLPQVLAPELTHLDDSARQRRVDAALALYADYGRGADGMQLPWVSQCFKAVALTASGATPTPRESSADEGIESDAAPRIDLDKALAPQDGSDSDLLLIDFR